MQSKEKQKSALIKSSNHENSKVKQKRIDIVNAIQRKVTI